MIRRRMFLSVLLAVVAGAAGCVRNVAVPKLLPKQPALTIEKVVQRIDAYADIKTVSAAVTIRFRDLLGATMGKNKEYPAANGRLILSRPQSIFVRVSAPFISKTIADMASDGEKFRLKILYPDANRKFILGSNAGRYKRVEASTTTSNAELQQAGTLANMRPQHLTDAFLIQPVTFNPETVYFLDEITRIERDGRPGTSKRDEVVRTYYVLTLLERVGDGPEARVQRRFWFDRTRGGTPLTRQEIYEGGALATSVDYMEFLTLAEGRTWPGRVRIERVVDNYSVEIVFERAEIKLNNPVKASVFIPENTENLPVVDLDTQPGVMETGRRAPQ
jgi:hypothetical protein